jgi:hypothetical protein
LDSPDWKLMRRVVGVFSLSLDKNIETSCGFRMVIIHERHRIKLKIVGNSDFDGLGVGYAVQKDISVCYTPLGGRCVINAIQPFVNRSLYPDQMY